MTNTAGESLTREEVRRSLLSPNCQLIKCIIDQGLCLISAILLLPLMAILALIVRCESAGPAFFRHKRIGYGGRQFQLWKLRTMYLDGARILEQYLQEHPDVDLVGAAVMVFGPGGTQLGKRGVPEHHAEICARPYRGFAMAHPTYLGRRDFFTEYRYATSAVRCEDQDLLLLFGGNVEQA